MTDEAIEIVLKAWTQETASHEGKFWRVPEFSLRPRIFQRPHPPVHMVASRHASVASVGARGWPVAMHFTPADVVARCIEEYHAAVAGRIDVPRDDELAAVGGMLIGSPEQVADRVDGLEAIGVDTLLLFCSFGNLSHAQVCRSLELLPGP